MTDSAAADAQDTMQPPVIGACVAGVLARPDVRSMIGWRR